MSAKDLIKAGKLTEARKQLVEEVKAVPGDLTKRTLLFQVLAYLGEWDKAERHLDAIVTQDSSRETGVQAYKNLIHAERQRLEVCRLKARPRFLPAAPPHLEMYFAAWGKVATGKIDEAVELYDAMDAKRPPVRGSVDGKDFEGFTDTDTFLVWFIEAMVYEEYVWVPLESIRELSVLPPASLLDLLWTRGLITTWDGLSINCYLPVLYPESWLHADDLVKLGRMTDWTSLGGAFSKGMGRHVYQIGEEEVALLDFTELRFMQQGAVGDDEKSH